MVLAHPGPFRAVADGAKAKAEKDLMDAEKKLEKGMKDILKKMRFSFELMSTKKTTETLEGQRFRDLSHQVVTLIEEILKGPVNDALEICRQHQNGILV